MEDPTAAKEIGKYCKGYLKNKKSFLGKKAKELLPGLKKRAKTDPAAVEMVKTVEGYIRELKLWVPLLIFERKPNRFFWEEILIWKYIQD